MLIYFVNFFDTGKKLWFCVYMFCITLVKYLRQLNYKDKKLLWFIVWRSQSVGTIVLGSWQGLHILVGTGSRINLLHHAPGIQRDNSTELRYHCPLQQHDPSDWGSTSLKSTATFSSSSLSTTKPLTHGSFGDLTPYSNYSIMLVID